jgi:hypothetical protein
VAFASKDLKLRDVCCNRRAIELRYPPFHSALIAFAGPFVSNNEEATMKNHLSMKFLIGIALMVLAFPVATSAQIYNRDYDRSDRRDVREAIARLDNASARLENDLNTGRQRRVLGGLFWVRSVDNAAVVQVRDFRQAVRDLRRNSRSAFAFDRSADEAREVLNRGVQLDRYLRLRTGSASVDADLAEIRSSLHLIADAYGWSISY